METKHCNWCNQDLEISLFGKNKSTKDGFTAYCRSCINAYNRKRCRKNPNLLLKSRNKYRSNKRKYRNWELIRLFGITIEDYESMLALQNHICAICNKPETSRKSKTLSVDHCHSTGLVRGLLCTKCNSALGFFKDNIDILEMALKYLKQFNQKGGKHGK